MSVVLKDDLRNRRNLLRMTDHPRLVFSWPTLNIPLLIMSVTVRAVLRATVILVGIWLGLIFASLLSFWGFAIRDIEDANVPRTQISS
jgi:hypothetical protein